MVFPGGCDMHHANNITLNFVLIVLSNGERNKAPRVHLDALALIHPLNVVEVWMSHGLQS